MKKLSKLPSKNIAIVFSGEQMKALKKLSAQADRSVGWLVRLAVDKMLHERETTPSVAYDRVLAREERTGKPKGF